MEFVTSGQSLLLNGSKFTLNQKLRKSQETNAKTEAKIESQNVATTP